MQTWPALDVSGLHRTEGGGQVATAELLQAALTDYDVAAVDERADDNWRVFFQTAAARDRALEALRRTFGSLSIAPVDVADEDWAARSQSGLRAVQIGRIIVAPPWDAPLTIVVQPSTGFGTGHHATTRLCLAALQRESLQDRTVLDVGTGSAVLAIAASRLGAAEVTGIDDDPDAIQAAWQNLALNPAAQVSLIVGDFRSIELGPADVILANLTGALLEASAERLRRLTNARGKLILSGFTPDEERAVVAAYAAFSLEHRAEEEGWVCVALA